MIIAEDPYGLCIGSLELGQRTKWKCLLRAIMQGSVSNLLPRELLVLDLGCIFFQPKIWIGTMCGEYCNAILELSLVIFIKSALQTRSFKWGLYFGSHSVFGKADWCQFSIPHSNSFECVFETRMCPIQSGINTRTFHSIQF